jgi:hypothetical protein
MVMNSLYRRNKPVSQLCENEKLAKIIGYQPITNIRTGILFHNVVED